MRVVVLTMMAAMVGVQTQAPEGYIANDSGDKAYKVMYKAEQWIKAKEECENRGASLAVPKSQREFQFLQKLVRGMDYPQIMGTQYKLLVWLGIYNFEDNTIWRNVDGEDISETGYNQWASTHVGLSSPMEPHCAGMDAYNSGLRVYWCNLRQPYICQILVATLAPSEYNEGDEINRYERFIFD